MCAVCVFLEQILQRLSYSSAEILFSQFFRQAERLICAVAVKGNFFEDSFSGEIFINLS